MKPRKTDQTGVPVAATLHAAELLLRLAQKKHQTARKRVWSSHARLKAARKARAQARKAAKRAKRRRNAARKAWNDARCQAESRAMGPRMGEKD